MEQDNGRLSLSMDDARKEAAFVMAMVESHDRQRMFETMSTGDLAALAVEYLWADMVMFTYESDLMSAIIDRLRDIRDKEQV